MSITNVAGVRLSAAFAEGAGAPRPDGGAVEHAAHVHVANAMAAEILINAILP
jgi:hypothetical protein